MTTATPNPPESQNDEGHLASLGYASEYKREMSFWATSRWASPISRPSWACTRCSPTPSAPAARR
ncbi:hypothetical protein [Aeromicrobium sp. UC242_57]|uniref:hypothetical protein n=1 Tax=Aeromicrobium sp. UC242_57 TaxID=3374624 RepID=UPI0037914BBB